MTAKHWMQIAALTSVAGFTGAAIGHDIAQTTGNGETSGISAKEAPASGAIVTPEDKALGFGKPDEQAQNRNRGRDEDTPRSSGDRGVSPGAPPDDISVNPGASKDDISVHPGPSGDDISVNPGAGSAPDRDNPSTDQNLSVPTTTGSHGQPAEMGPANMRGQ